MAASPSKLLIPAKVTDSGLAQLQQNELELALLEGVDIEFEGPDHHVVDDQILRGGIVHLTTHRLLWFDERGVSLHGSRARRVFGLPLSAVDDMQPPKRGLTRMFTSPRLRFTVWTLPDGSVSVSGPSREATKKEVVLLVFRGPTSHDTLVTRLQEVLQTKKWLADAPGPSGAATSVAGPSGGSYQLDPPRRAFDPSKAGVAGILRREEQNAQKVDKNLQDAFGGDLKALMAKATDMVALADRLRSKLRGGEEVGGASKQEVQDYLLSVGIASPVTKESAGALYHQQLARELADFLKTSAVLEKSGGMVNVVDVYCMVNRARGTALISPEDLLEAGHLWETLDIPLRLRSFDSNVIVIQSSDHSDDQTMAKISELARTPEAQRSGMSASDAARSLGIAPALAKEELLTAEKRGYLCRDDGPDGLRFYNNFFTSLTYTAVA